MVNRVLVSLFIVVMMTGNVNGRQLFSIKGSNTIGSELAPALVKEFLDKKYRAKNIQYIARESEEGYVRGFDPATGEALDVSIVAHGSSTGFKALDRREADIAMSSRPIKNSEIKKLNAYGNLKSMTSENVIGLDGIAVIIHKDNPLKQASKQQLQDIFSGKTRRWGDVSSMYQNSPYANKPIAIYARDDNSGTYDTFRKLVLGKKSKLTPQAKRFSSNADLSDQVSRDKLAIGFVGLPYIRYSKSIAVSDGKGEARLPNRLTVETEDYALSRRLFMYIPEFNAQPVVHEFMEFIQTNQGQKIVSKAGFVSQTIYASDLEVPEIYPAEYKKLTEHAQRLSVNIYFSKGSLKPDNRGQRDLKRIAEYISARKSIREVMLFGFSEDNDFPMFNVSLSESRADYVQFLLKKHGVIVSKIRGYGAVNQIAANENIEKNRRVEIWIK